VALAGKPNKRCQYLPPVGDDTRMLDLRDQILVGGGYAFERMVLTCSLKASPKDIEDLATAGQNAQTCPYYGSRRAIPQAEVSKLSPWCALRNLILNLQLVALPYNLLLQKTAREALGIDLTNQVVVIDEAHSRHFTWAGLLYSLKVATDLIPTLLSLSSVRLTSNLLLTSLKQVSMYYQKFRNRLSATHALHLKRLVGFLDAFRKIAMEWMTEKTAKSSRQYTEVMTVPDFIHRLGRKVEGINLLEIESYLKRSKVCSTDLIRHLSDSLQIAQKISRYAVSISEGLCTLTRAQYCC